MKENHVFLHVIFWKALKLIMFRAVLFDIYGIFSQKVWVLVPFWYVYHFRSISIVSVFNKWYTVLYTISCINLYKCTLIVEGQVVHYPPLESWTARQQLGLICVCYTCKSWLALTFCLTKAYCINTQLTQVGMGETCEWLYTLPISGPMGSVHTVTMYNPEQTHANCIWPDY